MGPDLARRVARRTVGERVVDHEDGLVHAPRQADGAALRRRRAVGPGEGENLLAAIVEVVRRARPARMVGAPDQPVRPVVVGGERSRPVLDRAQAVKAELSVRAGFPVLAAFFEDFTNRASAAGAGLRPGLQKAK